MHLIDLSNGRANMAFAGPVPWHGLGVTLQPDDPLDTWIREAGFGWDILKSPVKFDNAQHGGPEIMPGQFVLHRSDTGAPLSVVSGRYKVTQPREVAEFFRDLVDTTDFKMETMGMLAGGRRYWALASVADGALIGKGQDDAVFPYLLLASSCDGTLANVAMFTTVRVVCNNTLVWATDYQGEKTSIRVPHSRQFDPGEIKDQLGIVHDLWKGFQADANVLADRKVTRKEAVQFFLDVFYPADDHDAEIVTTKEEVQLRTLNKVLDLFETGPGQDTDSARGTAWGLVNAVTRYVDHEARARSNDSRLSSAWFGQGRTFKDRAVDAAVELC